jgi:hypothetical protein
LPKPSAECEDATALAAHVAVVSHGSATEILLEGIRARHSSAPAKTAGTAAGLAWIAETYPRPGSASDLPTGAPTDLKIGPEMSGRGDRRGKYTLTDYKDQKNSMRSLKSQWRAAATTAVRLQ